MSQNDNDESPTSTDTTVANDLEAEILAAIAGSGATVDPTQFRQTDAGNAQLFVGMFGKDLRYVEAWRRWMFWNGLRWIEASDIALTPLATQVTEHMFAWAATLMDEPRDKLRKHAMATEKKERLRAMIDLAKGDERIRAEPSLFDANPWLLGCGEATFNLRKKKGHRPKRKDYITKSTGTLPDPNADCPNWLALLDWAFGGDAETIEHFQHIAGYILTGEVSEEKLFAFFGGGGNGKTTIVMTLFEMLGDYAGKARSDLLTQSQGQKGAASPDVAELHGKRLVIVSETDDNCALAEAQVKAITSNEPITARKLHRDLFTFMPTHKTVLMTNHRPFVKGTDDGIWRRLNIIHFNAQITEDQKDPRFREDKLRPELPAILAWAIRGCFMWQHDGLKPSAAVKASTNNYRSEMDFMAQWLAERTVADPQASTTRSDAYSDYKDWAQMEGAPVLGNRRFAEEMHARGFQAGKSHGVRLYRGLRMTRAYGLHVVARTAAE
ncbi:phage/plasmid primase, P4 family [Methylocystis iwaonis]|uniref:DNA primase family protein n=1 Tax=Methylocystis iwaonis TaxID=2885079 RepID=UPI002E7BA90A|nr:phage/plasmid primase, P4 family [Methylocystis iwaonis]